MPPIAVSAAAPPPLSGARAAEPATRPERPILASIARRRARKRARELIAFVLLVATLVALIITAIVLFRD
jgi:hypothetical protein